MAEEQIVTNIVAKSDFSNLITDLNKVSSALTGLQDKLQATNKTLAAQVAVMNRSFAETMRSTGQFSTHFVSLSSDVEKFGSQLDKGQMKLGKFFQTYSQHVKTNGGMIRDLARQQVQLQNSILQPLGRNAEGLMQYNVHIPRGLDEIKNKTAIAKQELMIMNKVIQQGANQLINWLGVQSNGLPTPTYSNAVQSGDILIVPVVNTAMTGCAIVAGANVTGSNESTGSILIPGRPTINQGTNPRGTLSQLVIDFNYVSSGSLGVSGSYLVYGIAATGTQ